jgi:hypothetical protein
MYVFLAYAFAIFLFFVVDPADCCAIGRLEPPFLPQRNLDQIKI